MADLSFLVADDFVAMRRTLYDQLVARGVKEIHLAAHGREALQLLEEHSVDVIISDWNMPQLSGMDLLKQVRAQERFAHIHFMLVTAEGNRDSVMAALAEGVDQFLVKPFTPKGLRDKLEAMLLRPPRKKADQVMATATSKAVEAVSPKAMQTKERATVLVVDDVPTNIDVIKGMLNAHYRVKAATSGKRALEIVRTEPPDLVLLDIMMPEMDGYQVCETLKADAELAAIPIIFLTAKSEVADVTLGLELGAVDYITKPVDPAILLARVNTHLGLKRAQDQLSEQIDSLVETARLREDVERITRHDLKSPLAAIISEAEHQLESRYLGMEQRRGIEQMRDAANTMLGMINRSLDLYKMEVGAYQLDARSIDLVKVLKKVVSEARAQGQVKALTVQFEAPEICHVLAEDLLCLSLFGNLLKNAIEAAPAKSTITVALSEKGRAEVRIHNLGAVPPEVRHCFFDKYASAGKERGTGLGTYSARLMAEIQNGTIAFITDDAAGTTLTVTLPLDSAYFSGGRP